MSGAWARNARPAQAVVIIAVMLMPMILAVGIGVNIGVIYNARRTAQEAADAAAFAAAVVRYQNGTAAQAVNAAIVDAAVNGYNDGVNSTTVTVNNPPASGGFAGNADYFEVLITRTITTPIMPAAGGLWTVSVRAVGAAVPGINSFAIMALDRGSTRGALSVSSNGSINITGGGIVVNSSDSQSAQNSGTVTIDPSPPYGITTVGGVSGTWPNATTGQPATADPFGGYPKPSTSGLPVFGTPTCCALVPGVYTGTVNTNNDWTMAPGTYIFKGGGISLAGVSSLNGAGVFIFLTNANYPNSGGSCATFAVNGNNASSLTPITTGQWANMLIYQDAVCTGTVSIGGNGAISTSGTVYVPSGQLVLNGNNSQVFAGQIIAKTVDIQNGDLTMSFDESSTATPIIPALVE